MQRSDELHEVKKLLVWISWLLNPNTKYIYSYLAITVSMITQNILGPIMLAVTAFLLKIIQVMTE